MGLSLDKSSSRRLKRITQGRGGIAKDLTFEQKAADRKNEWDLNISNNIGLDFFGAIRYFGPLTFVGRKLVEYS